MKEKNKSVNTVGNNKTYMFSTSRQRSAITTKVNNNLLSFLKSKQYKCSSSKSKTKKLTMLFNQQILCSPLQLVKKENFKKFLKCFRGKHMKPIFY